MKSRSRDSESPGCCTRSSRSVDLRQTALEPTPQYLRTLGVVTPKDAYFVLCVVSCGRRMDSAVPTYENQGDVEILIVLLDSLSGCSVAKKISRDHLSSFGGLKDSHEPAQMP